MKIDYLLKEFVNERKGKSAEEGAGQEKELFLKDGKHSDVC